MPHIGCGADILRWRREKEAEKKRLQSLGLLPKTEEFVPAKNAQFPHHTNARDPDVFNARRCSWTKLAQARKQIKDKSGSTHSMSPRSPSSSNSSTCKLNLLASTPSIANPRTRRRKCLSIESNDNEGKNYASI